MQHWVLQYCNTRTAMGFLCTILKKYAIVRKFWKMNIDVYELSDNSELCRNCVGNCQNCLSFGKQLWIVRQFWIFRQWVWLSKGRKACHFISPQYITPQSQKIFSIFFLIFRIFKIFWKWFWLIFIQQIELK